eukprot:TRINITY_DN12054_c0_g1_i1.p1 TRINITY_DN12054_c0_g1~~TRINITY_DN12054_c0_g1_i1.p1  ORF type:complete len:155 (-),score=41.94 TRINITY_DN12054_c0_g1_i1:36-500(-)
MSIKAFASTVIQAPLSDVWKEIRDFTFPGKYFSGVTSVVLEDDARPTEVGAVRTMTWGSADNELEGVQTRSHQLLAVDDQYNRIVWELVASDPPAEVSATISTITASRVSDQNATFVTWESYFSADVPNDLVQYEQNAYASNLAELKAGLEANQ